MIPRELLKTIRRIEIRTSHLASDALAGQYHSAFKGQGMEFEEVRQYQVGDDVRSIDWNVSARYGEPYIKKFREERELTVFLVVDLSRSQNFGSSQQLKRDLIAELGATLAFSATRNNDKIGLLVFTDQVELFVPPRKGRSHVLRVIRELLAFEPKRRGTSLRTALEHLNRIARRKAVVFLISDFQDRGYEAALRIAARRHDVILCPIEDEREGALPRAGLVELCDQETGQLVLVDTGSRAVRRQLADEYNRRREARLTRFRQLKLDTIPLHTGHSFVEPLVAFFHRREHRR